MGAGSPAQSGGDPFGGMGMGSPMGGMGMNPAMGGMGMNQMGMRPMGGRIRWA